MQAGDRLCKKQVAVKVVTAKAMSPRTYEMARKEVELLRLLQGRPHVIQMIHSEVRFQFSPLFLACVSDISRVPQQVSFKPQASTLH